VARVPPAERVRERLRAVAGDAIAARMPSGYQRLGRVLLLRLPAELAPFRPVLGDAWRSELGVSSVLVQVGPVAGELREPTVELVSGSSTETEVVEHGTRWRLDAARVMFAAGNRTERLRFARTVRSGERVTDLFAGIGYFTVPAARAQPDATFVAVEKNPTSYRYLAENVRLNGVEGRVRALLGDNRRAALEPRASDRVVLGYLPSSLPWLDVALRVAAPDGATLHLHLVADARRAIATAESEVERALRERGATVVVPPRGRAVKAYGPGRTHVVVDVRVRPV